MFIKRKTQLKRFKWQYRFPILKFPNNSCRILLFFSLCFRKKKKMKEKKLHVAQSVGLT